MQFAHELFDPTALKHQTPIPEFKLNYIEYPTVLEAVKAHVQFLKSMGQPAVA